MKKSQLSGPGALHHVGIELPACNSVHSRIDPQRRRDFSSRALTLDNPTDTLCVRRRLHDRPTAARRGTRRVRRA